MKITFPHFGNTYIAAKALFEGLGIEYIIPPESNNKALEEGDLHSPDEICLPFKIMLGNLLQSIKAGADTIILPGSCGPCRFGEYCELKMMILSKSGYNIEFIVIDNPHDIGASELKRRINIISKNSNRTKNQKIKALIDSYYILTQIDKLENKCKILNGFETNTGEFNRVLKEFKVQLSELSSPEALKNCIKTYRSIINNIKIDNNKNPIKIAIIGEIYTIIEPYSNHFIEDILMQNGVSIKRTLSPSWWVKDMLLSPIKLNSIEINRAAKKYLPLGIGGHATECVGEATIAAKAKFDGVIQIFPLGCMPEIVSKAILKKVSDDYNIPVLSLMVDGLAGEAGIITRLEAFTDILERRK